MAKKAAAGKAAPVAAAAAKSAPKKHERAPKKSEADMLAKGRKLAADYLMRRDGMDEDMATAIVTGISPEDINTLIEEANTSTIERTNKPNGSTGEAPTSNLVPDEKEPVPDFATIPALAEHEQFSVLVLEAREAGSTKSQAEKEYKEKKAAIVAILDAAGYKKVSVFGTVVDRYKGNSPKVLDPLKLLEKGVSIDIINACYKSTEYDDVRLTAPKVNNG